MTATDATPQYLVGLDLVFSGASGYSVFDFPANRLLEYDLLDTGGRSSAQVAEKIERGHELFNKLANLAISFPRAIWVIETSDWLNSRMPQRERETLKSLALARGLAFGVALIYQTAIPFCLGVNEVRGQVVVHHASKRAQFEYIRLHYGLDELACDDATMNVTDAIALSEAFSSVYRLPAYTKEHREIVDQRLGKAVFGFQCHGSAVSDQLGSRSALSAMPGRMAAITLDGLGFGNHLTPEYRQNPQPQGRRWAGVDISATHPGVVVYDQKEEENPHIVFHGTFALDRPQPDRKKAQAAYEIAVASNILRALAVLKSTLAIEGVVFEYSDWHRGGRGKEFMIDRIAIDSLFFSYGALLAGAYHLKLAVVGVNASAAKVAMTGKKNAGKASIKQAISPLYPFLKSEHTRDAAALMLLAHGVKRK
jgi:hypothetical protein